MSRARVVADHDERGRPHGRPGVGIRTERSKVEPRGPGSERRDMADTGNETAEREQPLAEALEPRLRPLDRTALDGRDMVQQAPTKATERVAQRRSGDASDYRRRERRGAA